MISVKYVSFLSKKHTDIHALAQIHKTRAHKLIHSSLLKGRDRINTKNSMCFPKYKWHILTYEFSFDLFIFSVTIAKLNIKYDYVLLLQICLWNINCGILHHFTLLIMIPFLLHKLLIERYLLNVIFSRVISNLFVLYKNFSILISICREFVNRSSLVSNMYRRNLDNLTTLFLMSWGVFKIT